MFGSNGLDIITTLQYSYLFQEVSKLAGRHRDTDKAQKIRDLTPVAKKKKTDPKEWPKGKRLTPSDTDQTTFTSRIRRG